MDTGKTFYKWNIDGFTGGQYVNILSELTWEDIKIIQTQLKSRVFISDQFYFRGILAYGVIAAGKNQDSDYEGFDRTQEFSRSNNKSDSGSTVDLSLGLGYQFEVEPNSIYIAPIVGIALYYQDLRITEGTQTVTSATAPSLGPISGLDSRYEAHWFSIFIGAEFDFQLLDSLLLTLGTEFHIAYYYAAAKWNLRTDFQQPLSFEHFSTFNNFGGNVDLQLKYFFSSNWAVSTEFAFRYRYAQGGVDKTYFASGTSSSVRLNEVIWYSFGGNLGVSYHF